MSVHGAIAPSVVDFLQACSASGLVERARLDQLAQAHAAGDARRPEAVADYLVKLGELTRFQADKLLAGVPQGLAIGPYRLLCPLARGGMGVVYLARDSRTAGLVALKVLPPRRAKAEPRTLARFEREKEIGLALPTHPSLVQTIDAGQEAGVHFLALEYVPGRTMRQAVTDDGPMPLGAAARAFADAARGLHAAHKAGFVHRDFKPANLMLPPTGPAKLLDFGFALRIGEASPADVTLLGGKGYTLGTMDYLPPEQAADATNVGPAADLYALGCSLYFALAGCPPFPGGTPKDKMRWHRTDAPPPLGTFNPGIPAEFARLVDWLMAKSPGKRPPSAEAIAKELAKWADPPATAAQPPTSNELFRAAEARWLTARRAGDDVDAIESPANAGDSAEMLVPDPIEGLVLSRGRAQILAAAVLFAILTAFSVGFALGFLAR